jgi:aminopeptidase N
MTTYPDFDRGLTSTHLFLRLNIKSMKLRLVPALLLLAVFSAGAQPGNPSKDTTWKTIYRETPTIINDLVHTKLDVRFDYAKAWMYGKTWITLKPHFYPTDSLQLDAKGMEIKEVALMQGTQKQKLKYNYDGAMMRIQLNKTYTAADRYTIYIDYIAKPNELEVEGSAAITDAKGLYFINPDGSDKKKPIQIWTQGETEATSVWAPTIDRPNQKTTQETYMTVPAKYVTLSNGKLISQKNNPDGTRTDYWKMDLPHTPYLFFMGVGDFAVIKDRPYKGKEVSYYVEKDQAKYAKGVFGNTPEMMEFFSKKLGVDYPWIKYSQMVGRDYVSGAMENTTATLHQESAYQNDRQLVDGNSWEYTIAHELFHQWFGDLVTTESWSNLTVNESFANYSEYLWAEYKEGKDAADAHHVEDMMGYLQSGSDKKDLVRFHYHNKEDMFDAVSYNKGGRVLNMLRNLVGDDAFFKSLQHYLNANRFQAAEAHQLRLSFEAVTGKDMNWFWNQWYFGSGHPKLDISYEYRSADKKMVLIVKQTQKTDKVFRLPVAVDVYQGKNRTRYQVTLSNKVDTLYFDAATEPSLVNVDADKVLLAEKSDNKSAEAFKFQFENARNYLDRKEALDYFNRKGMKELLMGLNDPYAGLRRSTLERLAASSKLKNDAEVIAAVEKHLSAEKDRRAKAAAISFLASKADAKYLAIFRKAIDDSSYSVAGAGLSGLVKLEPKEAYTLAKKHSSDAKGALSEAITEIIMDQGTEEDFDIVVNSYRELPLSQEKLTGTDVFAGYLAKLNDISKVKAGIDAIVDFKNQIPGQYQNMVIGMFNAALAKITKAKGDEIKAYIDAKMK